MTSTSKWLKIEHDGFQLAKKDERYLRVLLYPLMELSPSDSSGYLTIFYQNSLFKAELKINSVQKKFASRCFDRDLNSLVDSLKRDLVWQLESWKSSRFFELTA